MEELEDGPGPSSSSSQDRKRGSSEAANNADAATVTLPEQLQKIAPAEEFVSIRHRWNTSEEIASILIAFDRHKEWLMLPQKIRPASGSMLLYNRKVVFYRRDGYCWKKRRNGTTIREDHMKLKVQGVECIYGSYVHSAILPTFHRRCYWLLQNPNIVLLHYLNFPYPEAAKPSILSVYSELKQKEWTKEELVDQLRPMLSQIGQTAEEHTDEEKKVEKVLEDLLPVLMRSEEREKKDTTTLNRLIAPRQSSCQLSLLSQTVDALQQTTQQQENQNQQDHLGKKADAHIHVPVFMNNSSSQPSQTGLTPLHITTNSPFQPILFQLPTNSSHISSLASLKQSESNYKTDIQTTVISKQQMSDSKINFFTSDSSNFILQHQSIQNQHNGQHTIPVAPQHRANATSTITSSRNHLPLASANTSEADTEMTDSCVSHTSLSSIKETQDIMVVKNPFDRRTDVSASSVTAMDVNSQSKAQMMHRVFQTPDQFPKASVAASTHLQSQPVQQQQSHLNLSQLIAQQNNHSLDPQSLAQTSLQLQSSCLPQQQNSAPFLTLHLKSANNSSDNSGFVLSLQGAALVAPESSSMHNSSGNQASSLNISNSNGLVLIASQNPSGQLMVNRISSSDTTNTMNNTLNQISTSVAPGAPFFSPNPCSQSQSVVKSEAVNPSLFTCNPTFTTPQQWSGCLGLPPPGTSVLPSVTPSHTISSSLTSSVNNSKKSHDFIMSSLSKEHISKSSSGNFDTLSFAHGARNLPQTSSCAVSSGPAHDHTKDLSKPNLFVPEVAPAMREAKDFNKMELSCSDLDGTETARNEQQAVYTMTNSTSNIFPNDKDMMTNPDSCDTFDGSFSSLPTSDLTLDDFLDLHDLRDLTGSPLGPVELSTSQANTSQSYWDRNPVLANNVNTDTPVNNRGEIFTSVNTRDLRDDENDPTGHPSNQIQHQRQLSAPQQQQQPPQQQYLACPSMHSDQHQMAPTSPNHPGAPPRTCSDLSHTVAPTPSSGPELGSCSTFTCSQDVEDLETDCVIKDFAPEWAYSKSNTKVLVAGPWHSKTSVYTCVFDGDHILAVLLQPGLLRCFTPSHNAGYSTLQVARDGVIISNCEIFEFFDREKQRAIHPEWFDFERNNLKLLLIERLDQLQRRLTTPSVPFQDLSGDGESVERELVERVEGLVGQAWSSTDQYPKAGQHNLTLLHLAAALGWAKLISCLLKWRTENCCVALEFEVDALSVDSHSCTPLMWACSLGHIDAALTLFRWNALPLKMCNKEGLLPLSLARQKGHYNLANQIEQLERSSELQDKKMPASSSQESNFLSMDISSPPPAPPVPPPAAATAPHLTPTPTCQAEVKKGQKKMELASMACPSHAFSKPMTPGPKLIRRFSEQAIGQSKGTLNKRNSVDILPSGQDIDHATLPTLRPSLACSREATSEPQLPVSPDMAFVASPAPRLLLEDKIDEPSQVYSSDPSTSKMDTEEIVPVSGGSPIIDVERISSDEEIEQGKDGSKHQMVTLANQIIAAIPERIKLSPSKGEDMDDSASSGRGRSESHSSLPSQGSPRPSSFGDDSGISTPVTDSQAFEEYRYPEFGTPASSLSPESTCLPSPYSPYSFTLDSPPPTTAEFTEYFNAPTTYMEKDFSQLTLSDQEQRKLYEAAKVIQNAYRHYRDKQLQQQKEIEAAVLIQSYYRRYKTYAYYKKMSHAAVLIQNQFRTYYAKRKKRGDSAGSLQGLRRESERLKKGRNQSVIIQQRFRSHYQRKSFEGKEAPGSGHGSGDAPNSSPPPPATSCPCPDGPPIAAADNDMEAPEGQQEQDRIRTGSGAGSGVVGDGNTLLTLDSDGEDQPIMTSSPINCLGATGTTEKQLP